MMIVSPLINLGLRVAPPRLAFRVEQIRRRRWGKVEAEWLLLSELVDRRRSAVDVGCNHGLYAGALAALCPRVHCVEPQPALAAALRRKLPRNCVVHEVAASDGDGQADLRVPAGDDGRASLHEANPVPGDVLRVPLRRLDDLLADEPVGFVKIDVEGHEMAVLRGAEGILTRDRPTLLVEAQDCHQPGQPFDLFRHLAARGYRGWFLWNGKRLPTEEFDLALHQRAEALAGNAPYVNNFVFQPAG